MFWLERAAIQCTRNDYITFFAKGWTATKTNKKIYLPPQSDWRQAAIAMFEKYNAAFYAKLPSLSKPNGNITVVIIFIIALIYNSKKLEINIPDLKKI